MCWNTWPVLGLVLLIVCPAILLARLLGDSTPIVVWFASFDVWSLGFSKFYFVVELTGIGLLKRGFNMFWCAPPDPRLLLLIFWEMVLAAPPISLYWFIWFAALYWMEDVAEEIFAVFAFAPSGNWRLKLLLPVARVAPAPFAPIWLGWWGNVTLALSLFGLILLGLLLLRGLLPAIPEGGRMELRGRPVVVCWDATCVDAGLWFELWFVYEDIYYLPSIIYLINFISNLIMFKISCYL